MATGSAPLRAIDLFSGAGGLTQGLRDGGFAVVGAIESDGLAAETYRLNHPGVKLWERDIRGVSTYEVKEALALVPGQLDLLAGCPPCQGFSTMVTLNGAHASDDERNDLIFEFVRFAKDLAPRAVLLENVPGLASDRRLGEFQEQLEALGYPARAGTRMLNAADYGVPQRRRRVVVRALFKQAVTNDPPRRDCQTVRGAIEALPPPGNGDPLHHDAAKRSERILKLFQQIPKDGGSRDTLEEDSRLKCHSRITGFKDVYGRMAWDRPAPTITGGCFNPSKGRFLHPEEDRAITLREAALLQTFPPTYQFSLRRGRKAAAAMIGNALPPRFVAAHASMLAEMLTTD